MQQSRGTTALLGWALVAAVAAACVVLATPASRAQEQPGDGERIYQQQCASCHGGDGQGGVVPGTERRTPGLRGLEVAYVDLLLRTGRMPPVGDPFDNRLRSPTVTGAQREALVAWMTRTYGLTGGVPPGPSTAGDPARGLALYSVQCAHCHGSSGGGGVAGAGAFTPPLTSNEPVVVAEAIRTGPFEMPQFSRQQISDEEVAAIVGFLNEISTEPRTPIFGLIEVNPVYAAGFVALLTLAMVLSLFWIGGAPAWFPDPRQEAGRPQPPAPQPKPAPGGDKTDDSTSREADDSASGETGRSASGETGRSGSGEAGS